MHADVARQALEPFRELEQFAHFLLLLLAPVEQRLDFARVDRLVVLRVGAPAQRDVSSRLERNQLGDLVAEVIAEIEHASTRPTSRTTAFAAMVPKVTICDTLSAPYFCRTYSITRSRPS